MTKHNQSLPVIVTYLGATDIDLMNAWRISCNLKPTHEFFRNNIPYAGKEATGRNGPIRTLTDKFQAEKILLVVSKNSPYMSSAQQICEWISRGNKATIEIIESLEIKDPSNYDQVYTSLNEAFAEHLNGILPSRIYFNLTSGSPAIQAILLYMSQVRFPKSKAFRSTEPQYSDDFVGVPVEVNLPFKMAADLYDEHSSIVPYHEDADQAIEIYGSCKTVNMLLLGESGVGKSEMAFRIHCKTCSDKSKFVVVNCAELSLGTDPNVFRAELFGSTKGAYTGAVEKEGYFNKARNGTLFFDEIAEIPLSSQALLLRALQEKKYSRVGEVKISELTDVRIIAATNHDLAEDVRQGRFRQDLYYRIAMCPVYLSPLRSIAEHYETRFQELVAENFEKIKANLVHDDEKYRQMEWNIDDDAMEVLRTYHWPGNIRQLYQVLLLVAVYAACRTEGKITASIIKMHLPKVMTSVDENKEDDLNSESEWYPDRLDYWLEKKKIIFIKRALKQNGGKIAEAARALGTTYQKVDYALKQNREK